MPDHQSRLPGLHAPPADDMRPHRNTRRRGVAPTSRHAYAAIQDDRERLSAQQRLILDWVRGQGERGATQEELAIGLRLPRASVAPRCSELETLNLVRREGQRKTVAGRWSVVWRSGEAATNP